VRLLPSADQIADPQVQQFITIIAPTQDRLVAQPVDCRFRQISLPLNIDKRSVARDTYSD